MMTLNLYSVMYNFVPMIRLSSQQISLTKPMRFWSKRKMITRKLVYGKSTVLCFIPDAIITSSRYIFFVGLLVFQESLMPRLSYAAVIAKRAAKANAASIAISSASTVSTSTTTTSTSSTNATESCTQQPRQTLQPSHSTTLSPHSHTHTQAPVKPHRPRYGPRSEREQNYEPSSRYRREYYPGRRSPPQSRQMTTK